MCIENDDGQRRAMKGRDIGLPIRNGDFRNYCKGGDDQFSRVGLARGVDTWEIPVQWDVQRIFGIHGSQVSGDHPEPRHEMTCGKKKLREQAELVDMYEDFSMTSDIHGQDITS
ncbi:hypothetical protein PAAG_05822 [Paracoccidioides lutzii Pb01]|uniref:Uncharacterized protein n=1 Tax=Paracoccidioides lutzii (strain ATCC MYA-826 / Pb01) TaxID=502779 RepID=C1H4Y1_PARBA|nr:hypothetical protein PAAG_05822 [Paracoccidioides lutzii Pb01]EEH34775.2 hypothetical protein PAAG_05822 [Paracoccidioides lutzii Pb01]